MCVSVALFAVLCNAWKRNTTGNCHPPRAACRNSHMAREYVCPGRYSVDYPYLPNGGAREFLETAPISQAEKEQIAHGNARRLLRI